MNSLDPDIKFIFQNVSTIANFLDLSCSIKNDQLIFDIYPRPTHSFSYLNYHSCHPQHAKNNIVLSLGQIFIRIVFKKKEPHLSKYKCCLIQRCHPREVQDYAMTTPSMKPTSTQRGSLSI